MSTSRIQLSVHNSEQQKLQEDKNSREMKDSVWAHTVGEGTYIKSRPLSLSIAFLELSCATAKAVHLPLEFKNVPRPSINPVLMISFSLPFSSIG